MTTVRDCKLSSLLKEKLIKLDFNEKDKKKILTQMVDVLASSGKIKDKKAYLAAILKREKLGSTGIGNGVAIPHSKTDGVSEFVLAFGRQSSGIDFGALDGEKTYLFFMLASPEENVGGHLKFLAEISRLVKDKFIVDRLRAAQDKKEIIKVIETFEK
jgi:fructose-specific phosphotransferase system IIA component